MTIKNYIYLGLVICLLAGVSWVWGLYNNYQTLKFEHQISLQNKKALEDSISIVAAQQTILTSKVMDLTSENLDLKGKRVALQIRNRTLLDSLHAIGHGQSIVTDSTAYLKFDGKQKFARFEGWTLAYLHDSSKNKWDLQMWFDTLDIKAILFKDDDGLWKLKTVSETDGVKVKGISTLDSDTFAALQKYSPPTPPKNFGLNIQTSPNDIWGGFIFRYSDQWYLNVNYRVVNGQSKWLDNTLFGISYFMF